MPSDTFEKTDPDVMQKIHEALDHGFVPGTYEYHKYLGSDAKSRGLKPLKEYTAMDRLVRATVGHTGEERALMKEQDEYDQVGHEIMKGAIAQKGVLGPFVNPGTPGQPEQPPSPPGAQGPPTPAVLPQPPTLGGQPLDPGQVKAAQSLSLTPHQALTSVIPQPSVYERVAGAQLRKEEELQSRRDLQEGRIDSVERRAKDALELRREALEEQRLRRKEAQHRVDMLEGERQERDISREVRGHEVQAARLAGRSNMITIGPDGNMLVHPDAYGNKNIDMGDYWKQLGNMAAARRKGKGRYDKEIAQRLEDRASIGSGPAPSDTVTDSSGQVWKYSGTGDRNDQKNYTKVGK